MSEGKSGKEMIKNKLCIFHKDCADGFGAALAIRTLLDKGDFEYYASHYGDPIPDVKGKDVYIV